MPSPRTRPASSGARTTLVAALAIAALASAACASKAPAPAAPRPAPAGRPAAARPATGAAAGFHYAAAPVTYEVVTEGTVVTDGDSAAPLRVATNTRVTLAVAPGGDERAVRGTVDAFTTPGGRAALAMRLPLHFDGTLDTRRHRAELRLSAPTAADTACLAPAPQATAAAPAPRPTPATPALSLLATARDLLPTAPGALGDGARWEEETETVECRGQVPVTTHARYRYAVQGRAWYAGAASAVKVTRTSESESRGERATGGHTVRVQGSSRGTFDLYLDPAAGRYLGGTGRTEGTLEVDAGDGKTRRFDQRFTTRVGPRGATR